MCDHEGAGDAGKKHSWGEAGKLCRGAFQGRSLRTAAKPKFENTF